MYAKMLVPTDGSACSERATHEAAQLARVLHAEITFLHVIDVFSTMRDGVVDAVDIVEAMRADGAAAIARAEEVARAAGVVTHHEVIDGAPADEIVRRAAAFDLVVMGSHGKGMLKQIVLGSVVHAVLHHVRTPVLVVTCKEHAANAPAFA